MEEIIQLCKLFHQFFCLFVIYVYFFCFKYDLDKSNTHPKIDPTGVQTHDLQILRVYYFHVSEAPVLTTPPSGTALLGSFSCRNMALPFLLLTSRTYPSSYMVPLYIHVLFFLSAPLVPCLSNLTKPPPPSLSIPPPCVNPSSSRHNFHSNFSCSFLKLIFMS